MPTVPRRPAAQQERDRLQARRLRAAELFTAGVRQAEVARQLEVSAQVVSVWHTRWRQGGTEAPRSRGPSGLAPRLSDSQLAQIEQLANLVSPTLAEVIDQAHRGIDRVRRTPHLAYSFLRHAGLSLS